MRRFSFAALILATRAFFMEAQSVNDMFSQIHCNDVPVVSYQVGDIVYSSLSQDSPVRMTFESVPYASWAGKRLPTEIEWQYAAQADEGNPWPWIQETLVRRVEGIEPDRCNLGDGELYPVKKYPKGRNPYGLYDLVDCVWQLTNDLYDNTTYRYVMLKGGSYFRPASSYWYVQGGPKELNFRQYLLRVSLSFERNATVGFRCVKGAK